MGVYIKDMEKPKKCENCQFYLAFYIGNKKVGSTCELTDDVKSIEVKEEDCPLIEIDLERDIPTIWYNRQTNQYEPKGTKQEVYEWLYKLKNGERKADEHNIKRD